MGINATGRLRIEFISFKFKYLQKVIHLTYLRHLSWCEMDCCLEVRWTALLSGAICSFPVAVRSLALLDET